MRYTSPALAALLLYSYPALVAGAAAALARTRPTVLTVVSLMISLVGVALALGDVTSDLDPVGVVLALGAAAVYTTYILYGGRVGGELDGLTMAAYISLFAAASFLIFGATTGGMALGFGGQGWTAVLGMAFASTVVAVLCFFLGMAILGPTKAAIGSMLEPVVSISASAALLGSGLAPILLVGAAMVLIGATAGVLARDRQDDTRDGTSQPVPDKRVWREDVMLTASADEVARLLDVDAAIDPQRTAFLALASGRVDLPPKIMHPSRFDDTVAFSYLARLSPGTGFVAKVGGVYPGNPARGLASVTALVIARDAVTGEPVAVLNGAAVTTLRTAAASAVAIDALARDDADRLALIGSGVQTRAHARAVNRVRPLRAVSVWAPTEANRTWAAEDIATELDIPVSVAQTPAEAVRDADLVVTCTLSHTPMVRGQDIVPATVVVSVGSLEPDRCEVDAELVRSASAVVVDDPATAAGPVVAALRDGDLAPDDLVALGDVLAEPGRHRRTGPRDTVFYNSVGIGVQAAARAGKGAPS